MRYRFKTRPYKHQKKALRKLLRNNGGALFMPMRSGKTKTAIDFCCIMQLKFGLKRVLVVCPLSVIGVWRNQFRIHKPDEYKFRTVIANYEMVYDRERTADGWEPVPRKSLYKFKPQIIIVDEAHKTGNPSTAQSREIYKLIQYLHRIGQPPKVVVMTGTPFHRKIHLTFGMWKILNEDIFAMTWSKYKQRYGKWGGYGGFKFLGTKRKAEWQKKIAPYTFLMKSMPYVPPQHEVVPYDLEESEAAYVSMSNDFIAWIGSGVLEAPIALVKALRLAQICGGRVRDSDGVMQRVGREKSRAFRGLIEQFSENEVQKFVVFARFVPELADITRECQRAGYKVYLMHGGTPGDIREQRIAEFDETKDRAVFVSQVRTGALGIDLSAASVEVFYSLPESLVDYDQDCARIRKFKDKRTLTYYYMIGNGTVEEVQLAALRANLSMIDAIERDPMLLSYEARG